MCTYSYTYYSLCRHGELIRLSYCDKATTLGLPQKHDRWRPSGPRPDKSDNNNNNNNKNNTTTNKQSGPAGSKAHGRSPGPDKASSASQPSSSDAHNRAPSQIMSTLRPSEPVPSRSWAQVAAGPVKQSTQQLTPIVNRIPRSALPDMDVAGAALHPSPHQYRKLASHDSPALDKSEYNKLNINIPLDTYSGFSMSLTHQDGKVQEIVTRFETLNERPDSSGSLSDNPRLHTGDIRPQASHASIVRPAESDIDVESDTAHGTAPVYTPSLSPSTRRRPHTLPSPGPERGRPTPVDDEPTPSPGSARAKKKSTEMGSPSPHSLGKAMPTRWVGKVHGPSLATAQRAMQREVRKRASQPELPTDVGRKTVRGSRSSIDHGSPRSPETSTHLTKMTLDAAESDVMSATLVIRRTPSKLQPSETLPKAKPSSPVRQSAGQTSNIRVTMSPTRVPRSSLHNVDAASQTHLSAGTAKHSHAPSLSSSVGGYKTARQSPVSQASAHSFHTAPCEPQDDVPEFDLTFDHQERSPQGPRLHSRGKSEPHIKLPSIPGTAIAKKASTSRLGSFSPVTADHKPTAGSSEPSPRNLRTASTPRDDANPPTPPKPTKGLPEVVIRVQKDTQGQESQAYATAGTERLRETYTISTVPLEEMEAVERNREAVTSCFKGRDGEGNMAHRAIGPRSEISRAASIASEATLKADPATNRDPVQNDSAIIFSRKKADGSGMLLVIPIRPLSITCMMAHSIPSTGPAPTYPAVAETSSVISKDSDQTSHSRAAEEASSTADTAGDPYSRRKTPGESSLLSSLKSGLRADVPEFIPQGHPAAQDQVAPSNEAVEYSQFPQPLPSFDPFGWDPYGNPCYNMLYTIQTVPPGATYDCGSYQPWLERGAIIWPKHGKIRKSNGSPRRPRQNRSADGSGSPSKHQRAQLPREAVQLQECETPENGDTTPRPAAATPPPSKASTERPADNGNVEFCNAERSEPFRGQLDMISELAATMTGISTGRGARHFTPNLLESVVNREDDHSSVHQGGQRPHGGPIDYDHLATLDPAASGYATILAGGSVVHNRFQGRPPRQERARGHHNRNWNSSVGAGVPLEATAPFPNPVPPRGPRRSDDEQAFNAVPSNAQSYMGYIVNNRNTCGHIQVVRTDEWSNRLCNTCDPRR
ncbi:uncharacterized protein EI97DRAFT_126191 [Westerdykella ornata]|uniref:Uncharacterized protein n=1 Tax=Westerdykella ornata TaxID=318751 RepID=A0A6A6JFC1_WESOR|nr:uncharacterized protein EI97DRAFT_126191 [Westerdykella ornata]KAF2274326.1 hypothetical protein EI97DRAFT_126191 [Westerdykella ornata]